VETQIIKKAEGKDIRKYKFIYSDVANDLSAPFQLTTYEFNEKIIKLLDPKGIYIFNLIDSYYSGEFLTAMVSTLEKSFPYINVFSAGRLRPNKGEWNTFVIVASFKDLDFKNFSTRNFISAKLSPDELISLKEKTRNIILTDDYAPVENLLKTVARQSGVLLACGRLLEKGNDMLFKEKYDEAISLYKRAINLNPSYAEGYSNIASALVRQGKIDEAMIQYKKALEINPNFAEASYGIGNILLSKSKDSEAKEYFYKAAEADQNYSEAYFSLANIFFKEENLDKAIKYYAKAIRIEPNFFQAYNNLGKVLLKKKRIQGAIECFRQALQINSDFKEARQNLELATSGSQARQLKDMFKEAFDENNKTGNYKDVE